MVGHNEGVRPRQRISQPAADGPNADNIGADNLGAAELRRRRTGLLALTAVVVLLLDV